jgi:hypothetical protein
MHLRETILLDPEADAAGGVAVDEVDEVPWDAAGGEPGGDTAYGFPGQAFEEAADCASHADLDLGDAKRKGIAVFTAAFVAVLPDQVYIVDADDLVAMDIDNLLVEQVALEQQIAIVLRQGLGMGSVAELQAAAGGELEVGDRDERGAGAAFGRGELENQTVNVSSIN